MTRISAVCLAAPVVLLAACYSPRATQGPAGDYHVFPAGDGKFQLVVRGYGTDQVTLHRRLHDQAARICGGRGYAISSPNATGSSSLLPLLDRPEDREETTVSALVECGAVGASTSGGPATAPDGRPYCAELDPEVERMRPAGYVSPAEGDCVPRPEPVPAAAPAPPPSGPKRRQVAPPAAGSATGDVDEPGLPAAGAR